MERPCFTRRGLLLSAGTGAAAALSGCSDLDARSDETTDRIPLTRLPEVPDPEESEPVLAEDLPVDVERDRLAETADRVTDLLGGLPMPLGPEDVPNGYVRGELVDAAERASDRLDAARSAKTRLSALQSLRRARGEARYAAAGWRFVEEGLTEAELRAERRETANGARAFRSAHEYVGEDPVRAVVVHAHVEGTVRRLLDSRAPSPHGDRGALLTVAEWGEHAESARARLGDSRYLYDRFEGSLPSDAGTLGSTFETAATSLTETLGERLEELPSGPEERGDGLAQRLRYRLRDDAESAVKYAREADTPARTVMESVDALVGHLAYDRISGRVEDGERFRVETGEDVRRVRSEALSAVRTGLEESPRPALVRGVLADAAWLVVHADDELARYRSGVRPARLDSPIRRYVTATARARSAPAACREVVDALER